MTAPAELPAHTPGPWHVTRDESDDDDAYDIRGADGQWIAFVYRAWDAEGDVEKNETAANAALIAAAPGLLEGAKAAVALLADMRSGYVAGELVKFLTADKAIRHAEAFRAVLEKLGPAR